MGKEISFTEKIQPKYFNPNWSRSKYNSDNAVNSNCNTRNKLSNKELYCNDYEGLE